MQILRCVYASALLAVTMLPARAESVADFFRGKSINLLIGASAGGGYDTLSRAVARYLPKHIPGNPTIITRNMPGAGGITAANTLYSMSPRDGTAMGLLRNLVPFEPIFGTPQAEYDATKFNWLGTLAVETGLLIVWHNSRFKTIDDARRMEIVAAVDSVNSQPAFYSRVINELLGTRIKIVAGYPGQNEAYLAIENGEVDTFGITYWSSLTSTKQDWLRDKKIRVLLQYGPTREADLAGVPYGPDLVTSPEDRMLFEAAYSPLTLGRPFVLPPDVPTERVEAFRTAFTQMERDPEFRAEANSIGLQIDSPRTGQELQDELRKIYAMPPDVLDRLRRLALAR
jgi:tripartite-type tricarboxylate transporter receptor subunit TctC